MLLVEIHSRRVAHQCSACRVRQRVCRSVSDARLEAIADGWKLGLDWPPGLPRGSPGESRDLCPRCAGESVLILLKRA